VSTSQPSDPALVFVPSARRYTHDIRFPSSNVNVGGTVTAARNYLTIVSKEVTKDDLTLNGTKISSYDAAYILII